MASLNRIMICPECGELFGDTYTEEDVIRWIQHLRREHFVCLHEIMRYMRAYDIPPRKCNHGGIHEI